LGSAIVAGVGAKMRSPSRTVGEVSGGCAMGTGGAAGSAGAAGVVGDATAAGAGVVGVGGAGEGGAAAEVPLLVGGTVMGCPVSASVRVPVSRWASSRSF
jgi:hypothetical protein